MKNIFILILKESKKNNIQYVAIQHTKTNEIEVK